MGNHRRGGQERCADWNGGRRTGHGARGIDNGPVVEKEGALMNEEFYDCLIDARGGEGIHGAEIGSHQCGPEANGEVLARHQVHTAIVAHPAGHGRGGGTTTRKQWLARAAHSRLETHPPTPFLPIFQNKTDRWKKKLLM